MTPADIVKILGAAAPIAASVASLASGSNSKPEVIVEKERKEPNANITNNISVTMTNNFYVNSEKEAMQIANQMQNQFANNIFSGTRYML